MTDFYGALQVPVPTPADPSTHAAGDPFLDTLAAFLQAALNADLGALWSAVHPAIVGPSLTAVPVPFVFTHDPDEASFSENQLPALFVWRAEEPKHVNWSQDWTKEISNVSVLWIPPLAQQEHRRIRQPFRNAFAKALHKNLYRGRNPAWIVAGDTEAKAADYGSLFITHAQVTQYLLRTVQPHVLHIQPYEGGKELDKYEGILATIEVWETLRVDTSTMAALDDVRGTVSIGMDADGLNALPILSYRFQPALTGCTPSSGTAAGGTAVTLTGKQFYRVDAFGNNTTDASLLGCTDATIATSDGFALQKVVFVDEGTITAVMPPHAATGIVGLVLTMPSGTTSTLAASFTYTFNPFAAPNTPSLAYVRPNYAVVGGAGTWTATAGDNITRALTAPAATSGAPTFADGAANSLQNATGIATWLGAGDHYVVQVVDGLVVGLGAQGYILWESTDGAAYAFITKVGAVVTLSYVVYDSAVTFTQLDVAVSLTARMTLQFKKAADFLWMKVGAAAWVQGGAIGPTYLLDAPPTTLSLGGDPIDSTITLTGTVPAFGVYKAAQSDGFADAVVAWAASTLP